MTRTVPCERLARVSVQGDATIRAAMAAIDAGAAEIALLTDAAGRLVGTVSDGDVRRALLGGAGLDDPVALYANRAFTAVRPDTDRAAVLDLMHARQISQVPVTDRCGRLVGLHLLREFIAPAPVAVEAVIMAGGRGTRLRPLTDSIPKPMLPVAGRPILERLVLHLVGAGVGRINLAVNYGAELVVDHFGDGSRFGCEIRYLREDPDRPLGTGGALSLLPSEVTGGGDDLLVLNGDLVTAFDVGRLVAAHRACGAVASVGAREHVTEVPYGVLSVREGRLCSLVEKPRLTHLVNAGVYLLRPGLARRVPTEVEYPITELLAGLVAGGERVHVHLLDGDWLDVGRPEELRRARGEEVA